MRVITLRAIGCVITVRAIVCTLPARVIVNDWVDRREPADSGASDEMFEGHTCVMIRVNWNNRYGRKDFLAPHVCPLHVGTPRGAGTGSQNLQLANMLVYIVRYDVEAPHKMAVALLLTAAGQCMLLRLSLRLTAAGRCALLRWTLRRVKPVISTIRSDHFATLRNFVCSSNKVLGCSVPAHTQAQAI